MNILIITMLVTVSAVLAIEAYVIYDDPYGEPLVVGITSFLSIINIIALILFIDNYVYPLS